MPIYDIRFWNGFDRVLKSIPRTSNGCEGTHSSINSAVGIARTNIARRITRLSSIDELVRLRYEQMKAGLIFRVKNVDFQYEYYLRNAINNYDCFYIENYLTVLRKITRWKIDSCDEEDEEFEK